MSHPTPERTVPVTFDLLRQCLDAVLAVRTWCTRQGDWPESLDRDNRDLAAELMELLAKE
jgi:hypothetical protein